MSSVVVSQAALIIRCDTFLNKLLAAALEQRQGDAEQLLTIDDRVTELVQALKAKGLESPYLRNFVVARIKPLRFRRGEKMSIVEVLDKTARAAERFNPSKIGVADLACSSGAGVGN